MMHGHMNVKPETMWVQTVFVGAPELKAPQCVLVLLLHFPHTGM